MAVKVRKSQPLLLPFGPFFKEKLLQLYMNTALNLCSNTERRLAEKASNVSLPDRSIIVVDANVISSGSKTVIAAG